MSTQVINGQAGWRWAVVTAVAGTVFIAAGAFWLSFTALADLAARSGVGEGQAWAWPLIVDGIIVVATVAVVALAGQRSAWYPWTLLVGGATVSVIANALHAIVAADADVPGALAAAVAAVPPVVLLAITHLTVILTRPLPALTDEPSAREQPAEQSAAAPATPRLVALTSLADRSTADTSPALGQNRGPRIVTGGLDRRARAQELRGRGWSNKRIAHELDVHPSTVGRWFAGAHLLDSAEHPNAQRPDVEEAKDL